MERVGILIVSKCLGASAFIDTLSRSEGYAPEFHVIEKQVNPFNASRAASHVVSPSLDVDEVVRFARKLKDRVAFGLTDTEDFITAGGRDAVESKAGVEMVCVNKKFAIEGSKAAQRLLFGSIFKEANPEYRIFSPKEFASPQDALAEFGRFSSEQKEVVVKPDAPARGAGVGVWGSDFRSRERMSRFFLDAYQRGAVVVERKVDGEESSFHALSDGKHFVPCPLVRDYKRSKDGDAGRLTGGMGSYSDSTNHLPFLEESDWERLAEAEEASFRRWKGRGSDEGLRGVVLYDAIMHTGRGFKVLERNSRGGNTEFVNLLTRMEDDFVDVCFRILEGTLRGIRFRRTASVVTCAVPLTYGTDAHSSPPGSPVDLEPAYQSGRRSRGTIRALPMDLRLEGGLCLTGPSRSVAVAGLGPTLPQARDRSLRGVKVLAGPLRWRTDIASRSDALRRSRHLMALRGG